MERPEVSMEITLEQAKKIAVQQFKLSVPRSSVTFGAPKESSAVLSKNRNEAATLSPTTTSSSSLESNMGLCI